MLPNVQDIVMAFRKGGYEVGEYFQVRGDWKNNNVSDCIEWFHPTDSLPTEEQILTWWGEYETEKNAVATEINTAEAIMEVWSNRASLVTQSAVYFQTSSSIIWDAIENGKPDVSAEEIEELHEAFSVAISKNPFWKESHDWISEMWDVALNTENPLHVSHGKKAFEIISWYSFNVVASSVAAISLQLSLNRK